MFWRRKRPDSDFRAEIEAHVALEADRLRAEGLEERDVAFTARRLFGNVTAAQERFYEASRRRWFEVLKQDVRFAARMLLKSPGSTAAIIATLALGIGITTAIFTLVNALLFTHLPYRNPERLVLLNRVTPGALTFAQSRTQFDSWKAKSTFIEDAALYSETEANLLGGDEPAHVHVAQVTANFVAILGGAPEAGRLFARDEDQPGHDVAILSDRLWRARFASDPAACGKTIVLNGLRFTVIGVLPAGFDYPNGTDIWTPTLHSFQRLSRSGGIFFFLVARMKPDATVEQVDAQQQSFRPAQKRATANGPVSVAGVTFRQPPAVRLLRAELSLTSTRPVLLLFGAAALVLLIGCTNVASLIMARMTGRAREFAVRRALGVTPSRLLRQLLTEHVLLGALGGLAGVALAFPAVSYMKTLLPANWPQYALVAMDVRVLAFASVLSTCAGVVSGIGPALGSLRGGRAFAALSSGERTGEPVRGRKWRNILVCAETALAMALLSGAGLLLRSFLRLEGADPGFKPHQVLAMTVSRPDAHSSSGSEAGIFYEEALARLRSVPGFRFVGGVSYLPVHPHGGLMMLGAQALTGEHSPDAAGARPSAITPGYFRAMGIQLLGGRDFDPSDAKVSAPVAILNETLARKLWPQGNAVGQKLSLSGTSLTVVGVVASIQFFGPGSEPAPEIYRPYTQAVPDYFTFVMKTDGPALHYAAMARSAIRSVLPSQPVDEIGALQDYVRQQTQRPRSLTAMVSGFAVLGFVLSVVGVYGLVAFAASRRTREFGIRLALGADPHSLLWKSAASALGAVITGTLAGALLSLATGRVLASELYGVKPNDPTILTIFGLLLIFTATLAGLLASRRISRVDPVTALRHE